MKQIKRNVRPELMRREQLYTLKDILSRVPDIGNFKARKDKSITRAIVVRTILEKADRIANKNNSIHTVINDTRVRMAKEGLITECHYPIDLVDIISNLLDIHVPQLFDRRSYLSCDPYYIRNLEDSPSLLVLGTYRVKHNGATYSITQYLKMLTHEMYNVWGIHPELSMSKVTVWQFLINTPEEIYANYLSDRHPTNTTAV